LAAELRERYNLARLASGALYSHRGGQGFKSPQLHPEAQVRAMIIGWMGTAKIV
jgi:hypothetical protein